MRALVLRQPKTPLELVEVARPSPASNEVLIRIAVCGVCRTDLDVVDGRIEAPRYPVTPGHQAVGRVAEGQGNAGFRQGARVGVAWIHSACGHCRWCMTGRENLCPQFESTGCDADGGYADYLVAPAAFVHAIPAAINDAAAAPLLCAGAIGWRALRLANLGEGQPLGLAGFGASAHLVLQLARHRAPGSPVFVFARDAREQAFARELGAAWAGGFDDAPPAAMEAVIDTTPAWRPLADLLPHVAPGGRFVINAIRKSRDDQPELQRIDYATHLWMEREIKSVANVTRRDVREVLDAAVEIGLRPTVREAPLERANEVLDAMRRGEAVRGATVLRIN